MIVHSRRKQRNRAKGDPAIRAKGTTVTVAASIVAGKARLTFNAPVSVQGLPAGITVAGQSPAAVTIVSPTVIDLTYAAPVAAADVLVLPANEPMLRSQSGGYVAATTLTFPGT